MINGSVSDWYNRCYKARQAIPIASTQVKSGHEVCRYMGVGLKSKIETIGAVHVAIPIGMVTDVDTISQFWLEQRYILSGLAEHPKFLAIPLKGIAI